jgi:predicted amidophosphoribosyltransferase
MRDRHFPRVCSSCRAPMARQEDTCWRCGTQWASEDGPRTTLTLIAGGAQTEARPAAAIAVAASNADRWANEGGSAGL